MWTRKFGDAPHIDSDTWDRKFNKTFTNDSPTLTHVRMTQNCILIAFVIAVSKEFFGFFCGKH